MQAHAAAPQGAGNLPNPYMVYGAPSGFAPLAPRGPDDPHQGALMPSVIVATRFHADSYYVPNGFPLGRPY